LITPCAHAKRGHVRPWFSGQTINNSTPLGSLRRHRGHHITQATNYPHAEQTAPWPGWIPCPPTWPGNAPSAPPGALDQAQLAGGSSSVRTPDPSDVKELSQHALLRPRYSGNAGPRGFRARSSCPENEPRLQKSSAPSPASAVDERGPTARSWPSSSRRSSPTCARSSPRGQQQDDSVPLKPGLTCLDYPAQPTHRDHRQYCSRSIPSATSDAKTRRISCATCATGPPNTEPRQLLEYTTSEIKLTGSRLLLPHRKSKFSVLIHCPQTHLRSSRLIRSAGLPVEVG